MSGRQTKAGKSCEIFVPQQTKLFFTVCSKGYIHFLLTISQRLEKSCNPNNLAFKKTPLNGMGNLNETWNAVCKLRTVQSRKF